MRCFGNPFRMCFLTISRHFWTPKISQNCKKSMTDFERRRFFLDLERSGCIFGFILYFYQFWPHLDLHFGQFGSVFFRNSDQCSSHGGNFCMVCASFLKSAMLMLRFQVSQWFSSSYQMGCALLLESSISMLSFQVFRCSRASYHTISMGCNLDKLRCFGSQYNILTLINMHIQGSGCVNLSEFLDFWPRHCLRHRRWKCMIQYTITIELITMILHIRNREKGLWLHKPHVHAVVCAPTALQYALLPLMVSA